MPTTPDDEDKAAFWAKYNARRAEFIKRVNVINAQTGEHICTAQLEADLYKKYLRSPDPVVACEWLSDFLMEGLTIPYDTLVHLRSVQPKPTKGGRDAQI